MGGNRPITRPQAHVRHPAPGTRCPLQGGSHHQGHASITMTLDRYSHWPPIMGRHAADGMDEALGWLLLPSPQWSEQGILLFYGTCR
jgi:hypothetical protein